MIVFKEKLDSKSDATLRTILLLMELGHLANPNLISLSKKHIVIMIAKTSRHGYQKLCYGK